VNNASILVDNAGTVIQNVGQRAFPQTLEALTVRQTCYIIRSKPA